MAQENSAAPAKAPWMKIFSAFKIALDIKKLILAAAGILLLWLGWWALSWTFYSMRTLPEWKDFDNNPDQRKENWAHFKAKRSSWNLLHELAGSPTDHRPEDPGDLASDPDEYDLLQKWNVAYRDQKSTPEQVAGTVDSPTAQRARKIFTAHLVNIRIKPAGKLRIDPWSEERGENPYLVVAKTLKSPGNVADAGTGAVHWLFSDKVLVLLEPLVKFLLPIVYLFDARAGGWERIYLILMLVWTLAVWGFFGGAICRIAAMQVALNERISLREALAFTRERFASYVAAPLFPLLLLGIFVIVLMVFGWLIWIPYLGELLAGLLWPIVLLIGFTMAIVLVGLVGWPLMVATLSTEGTDSFDALSRSYSYIYQAPWQYLWYNFLAIVYGAVLIFFVGFMASLLLFVSKWGVSTAVGPASSDPASDREPSYLFYYAPTTYGWRDLLLSSNPFTEVRQEIAPDGRPINRREFMPKYEENMHGNNRFGAFLVSLWIDLLFLLVLGFSYSYFWTSSTIIYFLMRNYVDDTQMDEVHQEDEDLDDPFLKPAPTPAPTAAPAPAANKPGTLSLNVVEAPPPVAPPPVAPPAPSEPIILAPPPPIAPTDGHT